MLDFQPTSKLQFQPTINNCGVGPGGFQEGNTCAKGGSGGGPVKDLKVYTGGSGRPGKYVTYFTTDKSAGESYVEMYNDRLGSGGSLHESKITISNPAPEKRIMELAEKFGIDNEYNTPASVFDAELHGDEDVERLTKALIKEGYDGAILKDIPYGQGDEMDAYIKLTGAKPLKEAESTKEAKAAPKEVKRAPPTSGKRPAPVSSGSKTLKTKAGAFVGSKTLPTWVQRELKKEGEPHKMVKDWAKSKGYVLNFQSTL
jgi:hypothetical protein